MADSYRLAPLKLLTTHLQGISKANGYEYNLGITAQYPKGCVFRGRTLFGEGDPIPMLSILESPRADVGSFAGENGTERKDKFNLLIQGWAHDDVDNPTDPAYALMEAVEHRLQRIIAVNAHSGNETYPDEYMLGRTIGDLIVFPGSVRPPMAQVSSKAFFYLPVQMTLVRNNG